MKPHVRLLTLGLTLAGIVLALGYIFIQQHTFAETTVPLSQTSLMQGVSELEDPVLGFWMLRYGSVFVLGALGLGMVIIRFWKIHGLLFAVPFLFFMLTTFYRAPLDTLWGSSVGNLLFGAAITTCLLGFVLLAWRRRYAPKNENVYIAFVVWFLFWVALTRDAKRYDFFIGISIAFFTADLIQFLADFYGSQVKRHLHQHFLKTAITGVTLTLILFWTPVGGHATRTLFAATKMATVKPRQGYIVKTLEWMKGNLPRTAVVAANWSYGGMLNVLAGVKTIIDPDHYIPHWIHLYKHHVRLAKTEREALEFLKTHNATHLMLTGKDSDVPAFLRGEPTNSFVPVYPEENFEKGPVKVWALRYPPDIQSNPKYLATEPEE